MHAQKGGSSFNSPVGFTNFNQRRVVHLSWKWTRAWNDNVGSYKRLIDVNSHNVARKWIFSCSCMHQWISDVRRWSIRCDSAQGLYEVCAMCNIHEFRLDIDLMMTMYSNCISVSVVCWHHPLAMWLFLSSLLSSCFLLVHALIFVDWMLPVFVG